MFCVDLTQWSQLWNGSPWWGTEPLQAGLWTTRKNMEWDGGEELCVRGVSQ